MRRRVRLTEGQLRGVVEEASRRVIQEMIDEGFFNWLGNAAGNVVQGATNLYNSATNAANNAAKTVVGWGKDAVDWGNQTYNAAKQGVQQAGNDFRSGYQQGRQNQQPAYLTAIQQYYNKQKQQRR